MRGGGVEREEEEEEREHCPGRASPPPTLSSFLLVALTFSSLSIAGHRASTPQHPSQQRTPHPSPLTTLSGTSPPTPELQLHS